MYLSIAQSFLFNHIRPFLNPRTSSSSVSKDDTKISKKTISKALKATTVSLDMFYCMYVLLQLGFIPHPKH